MGSHMSCMYSPVAYNNIIHNTAAQLHNSTITILNGCTGAIAELPPPILAAELMIDHPGFFISCFNPNPDPNPNSESRGRHLCSAVPAEHDLGTKEIYLLLPMQKLNSRLTEKENEYFIALLQRRRAIALLQAKQDTIDCISRLKFCRRSNGTINGRVAPFPANQAQSAHPASSDDNEENEYDEEMVNFFSEIKTFKNRGNRAIDTENRVMSYGDYEEDDDELILEAPASLRRLEGSMGRSKSWIPSLETISEVSK